MVRSSKSAEFGSVEGIEGDARHAMHNIAMAVMESVDSDLLTRMVTHILHFAAAFGIQARPVWTR